MTERVIYLHGFASGPASKKARLFAARLPSLEVPELAREGFAQLTIRGQLQVIEDVLRGSPAILIGSSMGGYLAALYAAAHPEISKVVLMAPAFRFAQRWAETLGPEGVAEWEATGGLPVFHYGLNREERVGWELLADARRHDPEPAFRQPALLFHGTHDDVVPVEFSRAFAARHRNVTLREMDSNHELMNVVDQILEDSIRFIAGE